jgi:hypothetical protein
VICADGRADPAHDAADALRLEPFAVYRKLWVKLQTRRRLPGRLGTGGKPNDVPLDSEVGDRHQVALRID